MERLYIEEVKAEYNPDFKNEVTTAYARISAYGGWFVIDGQEGEVAIFHGIKTLFTFGRVAFETNTIREVRSWLAEDETRKVLCCYSAYLPEDIKSKAVLVYGGPVYAEIYTRDIECKPGLDVYIYLEEEVEEQVHHQEEEDYLFCTNLKL